MDKLVKDYLYSARWAITEAIERGAMDKVDYAASKLIQAKAAYVEPIEPDRPDIAPSANAVYEIPNFVIVPGIRFKTHGNYKTATGQARGLVIHYTVSGGSPQSAKSVLAFLAKRGLGCPVMDHNGTIYIPEGFDILKDVAWHAGKSSWQGVSGISRYCIGIEMCCWGKLNSKTANYATKRRKSENRDNITLGEYEAYTVEQERSLRNLIMWLSDINPEFDINWVVGHDEISPGRKSDPGASLSMTMPELRAELKGIL